MDVHLRDVRYFVAVAEHLHFTRAAEDLFVSQPALSKQIRLLENQLGTPLFVRDRRAVRLTAEGEAFLPRARALLNHWDDTVSVLATTHAEQLCRLVIGFSTGVGRGVLPVVRARLAQRAPHARLRIRQIPWEDPTGGLAASGPERSDAAFVWLPLPEPARYQWLDVATEPRLLALPTEHRLAARETIAFAELLDEPFLALPAASGALRDYWLATEARDRHPIRIGAEISSTDETVEALNAGLGVCLVAAGNAGLVARDGVVIRPVTGISDSRLVFAWHRDDTRPLLTELREAVAEAVTVIGATRGA